MQFLRTAPRLWTGPAVTLPKSGSKRIPHQQDDNHAADGKDDAINGPARFAQRKFRFVFPRKDKPRSSANRASYKSQMGELPSELTHSGCWIRSETRINSRSS